MAKNGGGGAILAIGALGVIGYFALSSKSAATPGSGSGGVDPNAMGPGGLPSRILLRPDLLKDITGGTTCVLDDGLSPDVVQQIQNVINNSNTDVTTLPQLANVFLMQGYPKAAACLMQRAQGPIQAVPGAPGAPPGGYTQAPYNQGSYTAQQAGNVYQNAKNIGQTVSAYTG